MNKWFNASDGMLSITFTSKKCILWSFLIQFGERTPEVVQSLEHVALHAEVHSLLHHVDRPFYSILALLMSSYKKHIPRWQFQTSPVEISLCLRFLSWRCHMSDRIRKQNWHLQFQSSHVTYVANHILPPGSRIGFFQ